MITKIVNVNAMEIDNNGQKKTVITGIVKPMNQGNDDYTSFLGKFPYETDEDGRVFFWLNNEKVYLSANLKQGIINSQVWDLFINDGIIMLRESGKSIKEINYLRLYEPSYTVPSVQKRTLKKSNIYYLDDYRKKGR